MTHQHISFFKSGTRIAGYLVLLLAFVSKVDVLVGVGLTCIVFGEILGIVEELAAR